MKRRWILWIIAANLTVFVALAFIYPHLMVSPGPLIPAHAGLTADCFACHAPLRGATAERCVACHAVANIGLLTTKGEPIARSAGKVPFHQALAEQNCMGCHTDHPLPILATARQTRFSHALLAPVLNAKCSSCHAAPTDDFHRDLNVSCGQCHGQDSWKPATFDHSRFFVLDRDHNATCTTCHVGNDFSRYTCFGCHEHRPAGIRAEHLEEGIRNFEDCVSCHKNAHDEPGEGGSREGEDVEDDD